MGRIRGVSPIAAPALIVGLVECARGALLFTLLPNFLRFDVGHEMKVVGLALSVWTIADLALKLPSGWLVDHAGRRRPLQVGILIMGAAVVTLSQVQHTWGILAATAIGGLGASPIWPAAVSAVADATDEGGRGGAMGAVFTSWMVGTGIGFVSANFFLEFHPLLGFGFVIACLVAALFLTSAVPAGPAHAIAVAVRVDGRPPARESARVGNVWPFIIGMLVQMLSIGMLMPTLSPYAREVLKLSPFWIGALLVSGPGFTVLLLVPFGRFIDRVRRIEVLPVGLAVAGLVLFVLPFFRSILILVFLMAILGLGYALVLPAWNALIMDLIPARRRATLLGVAMSIEGMGLAIGTTVGGVLWDQYGPVTPFHAAGVLVMIVAVGYVMVLRGLIAPTPPHDVESELERASMKSGAP